jgi:SH3 domain protein
MFTNQQHRSSMAGNGFHLFFLCLSFTVLTLVVCPATATAENTYSVVSEFEEVPVRSGKGTEYKILALLKNGEAITSLEEDVYWIKARTSTGKEGWVLKRYLSSTSSPDDALTLPNTKPQTTEQPEKTSPSQNQSVKAIVAETTGRPTPSPAQQPHPQQQRESLNPVQIEQSAGNELVELKNKLVALDNENKKLREDKRIEWFLAGGGVFFIGWLLGLISSKVRRRRPSLL